VTGDYCTLSPAALSLTDLIIEACNIERERLAVRICKVTERRRTCRLAQLVEYRRIECFEYLLIGQVWQGFSHAIHVSGDRPESQYRPGNIGLIGG